MTLYEYFFKKAEEKPEKSVRQTGAFINVKPVISKDALKDASKDLIKANKRVYIVLDKNSNSLIGVFNSLEHAKISGNKTTHNNAIIYPFNINEPCKYLNTSIYES